MFRKILYTIWIIVFVFCIVTFVRNANFKNFVSMMEDKTFDIRQRISVQNNTKESSSDIVIIAIDDASYEYILNTYGEWPLPRNIYVELLEYLEAQDPQSVIFDMMFIKSQNNNPKDDAILADAFKKYQNAFTAMNFDNQTYDVRLPESLPEKLELKVTNNSKKVNLSANSYTNYRGIVDDIIKNTSNIGLTNVSRSDDSIHRI